MKQQSRRALHMTRGGFVMIACSLEEFGFFSYDG